MSTTIFPQNKIPLRVRPKPVGAKGCSRWGSMTIHCRRRSLAWFLAAAFLVALPTNARAVVPLVTPPVPKRVALADLIVIGKVTALEEKLVDASPLLKIPGVTTSVSYRVAVVRVDETMQGGKKDQSKIRVAVFQPVNKAGENRPKRMPKIQLAADQQGCFFLRKHPDESFYVVQEPYEFLEREQLKDFGKEVALVKKCAELLNDPNAALESKDVNDRILSAAMLIFRYRTPVVVYAKEPMTEPIDAKQSKRILTILAEADWTEKTLPSALSPLSLFLYLSLTEQDGWRAPEDPTALADAARAWLRKNAATYRIQRFVAELPPKK
jgi:hypothetical protein